MKTFIMKDIKSDEFSTNKIIANDVLQQMVSIRDIKFYIDFLKFYNENELNQETIRIINKSNHCSHSEFAIKWQSPITGETFITFLY